MALAYTLGPMDVNTTDYGKMGSSMEKVNTSYHQECKEEALGAKVIEKNG